MKVGLISFHSFFAEGGVKRHVLSLKKEFERKGVKCKIIVPRRKLSENYGPDVILLGTSFPISAGGTRGDICINFTPLSIEKTLRREKFDVLHFHNFGSPLSWQILEESEALNILTFHANIENIKVLEIFPELFSLFKSTIQWKIDGIIGVSPLTLRYFRDFKGPKKIIPNGINLQEFNPKISKIKKFQDNKINILFLGRIEERKGLIYLLKAYKILEKKFFPSPNLGGGLRLIIVGDGELRQTCENWAKENNLKEVYFEGEKKDKEVPSYYATADVFVSPAIFGESFGMVLLEAMACGKPVLAFANRGYKDFLKGKRGTFLAPPKDYRALAKKIEILVRDESLRKKMGKWGREEAKKYSWDKIADQVLNFYQLCQKEKASLRSKV